MFICSVGGFLQQAEEALQASAAAGRRAAHLKPCAMCRRRERTTSEQPSWCLKRTLMRWQSAS